MHVVLQDLYENRDGWKASYSSIYNEFIGKKNMEWDRAQEGKRRAPEISCVRASVVEVGDAISRQEDGRQAS